MHSYSYMFFFISLFGVLPGGNEHCPQKYETSLKKETITIEVDGKLDDEEWGDVKQEINFTFPWQDRMPPPTEFFAIMDTSHFYFAYRVEDKDIVMRESGRESDVAAGDRVEIFFAGSQDLEEYYCLEIGPGGSVLDYKASFYRKFNDSWDFPGLLVKANLTRNGYTVEGSIPVEVLKSLGILEKAYSCFLIGLYRAEFSHTKSKEPRAEWISWVQPDTKDPDFHVPSSFGCFCIKPD